MHVTLRQLTLLPAARLVDVSLRIREIFRDPMLQDKVEDFNDEISKPVQGQPTHDFGHATHGRNTGPASKSASWSWAC